MSTTYLSPPAKTEVRTIALNGGGDSTIALRSWLRGFARSKPDQKSCADLGIDPSASEIKVAWERRNLDSNTPEAGGYLVGQDFAKFFQKKLRQENPTYASSTVVADPEGAQEMPVPYADDTDNEGSHHQGEVVPGNQISVSEPTFGRGTLYANKFYSSGILSVSTRLLRSNLAEQIVSELLATRIGRLSGRHHSIGDGSGGTPIGIFNAIDSTVTSEATSGVTAGDIKTLMLALDVAYRPRASFLMHSQTFASLVELRGGDGQQLLPIEWGPLPRLHKHPVILTDFAPTATAAGNRSIVFADVSRYLIRECGPLKMFRYVEGTLNQQTGETIHFAENNCTGFQAQLYSDAAWRDQAAGCVLVQKS